MLYLRETNAEISYKIAKREDKNNTQIYCKEYAEQSIRDLIRGQCVWEDSIVIDELIKKGALIPN